MFVFVLLYDIISKETRLSGRDAADKVNINNNEYNYDDGIAKSKEMLKYNESTGELFVSNTVFHIQQYAYASLNMLNTIIFEKNSNLKSIGVHAFESTGIRELHLPDSITQIGIHAFRNCNNLNSIRLPNQLGSTTEPLFSGCYGLSYVYYSGKNIFLNDIFSGITIKEIHLHAGKLDNPFKKSEIVMISRDINDSLSNPIMEKLRSLEPGFSYITETKQLRVDAPATRISKFEIEASFPELGITKDDVHRLWAHKGLVNIQQNTFSDWVDLIEVEFEEGCKASIERLAFSGCGIISLTLPDPMSYIYNNAFQSCLSLTFVKLPKNLKSDSVTIFNGCTSLSTVYYCGTTVFQYDVFYVPVPELHLLSTATENYFSKTTITKIINDLGEDCLPSGSGGGGDENVKMSSDINNGFVKPVGYTYNPDTKELIVESVIENIVKADLQNVVDSYQITFNDILSCFISKEVKYVKEGALSDCASIEKLVFEEGSTINIEKNGCANLAIKRLEFADSIIYVGNSAFTNCQSLEFVKLPKSLYPSSNYLFPGCNNLRTVYYCGNVNYFQYLLFGVEAAIQEIHLKIGSELDEFQNYKNKIIKDLDPDTCKPFVEIRTSEQESSEQVQVEIESSEPLPEIHESSEQVPTMRDSSEVDIGIQESSEQLILNQESSLQLPVDQKSSLQDQKGQITTENIQSSENIEEIESSKQVFDAEASSNQQQGDQKTFLSSEILNQDQGRQESSLQDSKEIDSSILNPIDQESSENRNKVDLDSSEHNDNKEEATSYQKDDEPEIFASSVNEESSDIFEEQSSTKKIEIKPKSEAINDQDDEERAKKLQNTYIGVGVGVAVLVIIIIVVVVLVLKKTSKPKKSQKKKELEIKEFMPL